MDGRVAGGVIGFVLVLGVRVSSWTVGRFGGMTVSEGRTDGAGWGDRM